MKVTEIAFSAYPVTDMERALAFYRDLLGLEVSMDHQAGDSHWVEFDIGSGTLALGRAGAMKPSAEGCSVTLEVEDFDAAIEKVKAAGVPFLLEPMDTGVCHMAFVADPDGNSVGLHKRHSQG